MSCDLRLARQPALALVALGLALISRSEADRTPAAPAPPAGAIVPVRVARAWTTALAPNARGGWNFITQTYEHGSGAPSEWIVLDLASGKQRATEGLAGVYANSNYQIAEQLRAPGGRIFFPEADGHMAYYDPRSETVEQLAPLPPGDPLIFRAAFGPDGQLYGGTQSTGLPTVFRLDPDTLRTTVLGRVGRDRRGTSYAYYLAADPPWLYVAVGQSPWELVALDTATGEQRLLATRGDDGFLQLDTRPEGISVTLIRGLHTPAQSSEIQWCADGHLFPFVPGQPPPFAPRRVAPRAAPVTHAPEVDTAELDLDSGSDAAGIGHLRWRPDATAPWRDARIDIARTAAVDIDSLVALPDGTLLGSAAQYHGFFRYDPATRALHRYRSLGLSGGPRAILGGITYFAGYPNGVLYAYDPARPWTATVQPRPDANPSYLGNFSAAGAHYAYFLEPSAAGRLYYAGRRERDGVGGAIGYYDLPSHRFAGHHDQLDALDPRGLAVVDDLATIVYSGRGTTPRTPAQLVLFDRELRERGRQTVVPGMRETGALFPAPQPHILIGVSATDRLIYRHDIATAHLLVSRPLPGPLAAATQRPSDQSIWLVSAGALWRYDPTTLTPRRIRDLPAPPSDTGTDLLVWQGRRLFWTTGPQLRELFSD